MQHVVTVVLNRRSIPRRQRNASRLVSLSEGSKGATGKRTMYLPPSSLQCVCMKWSSHWRSTSDSGRGSRIGSSCSQKLRTSPDKLSSTVQGCAATTSREPVPPINPERIHPNAVRCAIGTRGSPFRNPSSTITEKTSAPKRTSTASLAQNSGSASCKSV